MKFSQKKFIQFTLEKQIKVIADFILAIEQNWQHKAERSQLLKELVNCLLWSKNSEFQILIPSLSEVQSLNRFLSLMIPWEHQNIRALRDHDFLIRKEDGVYRPGDKIALTVILHDLRSAFNVGSIIRTAECLGVEKLIFSGYTPTPDNKKVQDTSMGSSEYVEWEKTSQLEKTLENHKSRKFTVYGLETTSHATDIYTCDVKSPAVLILGNEALGISRGILNLCDHVLELPTAGWKNSLNVGVAFSVAGYEILRKWKYGR